MKKLATLFFSLAVAVSQTGFALADDTASNDTTGPDSTNNASIEQQNDVNVDISNSADVNYDINLDLNTGGNTVSHNTTAGDLVSGDINANIKLVTSIDQGGFDCDGCFDGFGGGSNSVSNSNTGPDSWNDASIKNSNHIDFDINNEAFVNHNLSIAANTGGNTCSENTTVGDCRSGDINVGIDIVTEISQGGVGGDEDGEEPGEEPGEGEEEEEEGAEAAAAVGGAAVGAALFPAGSSLVLLLAMLILAANVDYLLRRRNYFATNSLGKGKVGKGKK